MKVGIKALAERSRLELIRSIGNVLDSLPLFLWALFTAVVVQATFDCSGRLRRLWCVCATHSSVLDCLPRTTEMREIEPP